jgi:1-deoxy-D-xylulose-5-phosphate reductoisomerase
MTGEARVRVAVLGSTGSIGRQTLEVAAASPERVEIVALAANSSGDALAAQARAFDVRHVAIAQRSAAPCPDDLPAGAVCGTGMEAVAALAADAGADVVVNALVGAAGLRASESALRAGMRLALANKESLVVGGELLMPLAGPGQLVPVDSEHSAIFQCLEGEPPHAVALIWLTASGGPFRGYSREQLASVTVEQALAHPRWTMGPKITIDSATLMNKGLEAIEAHHLFGVAFDRIRPVVHPQSTVHSMVEFVDGSVKAHLGAADMRIPIQYALSYPDRWSAPAAPLDFTRIGSLDFEEPRPDVFRCLDLALQAGRTGGTLPAVLNAVNEVAVAAFLAGEIALTDIDRIVGNVMGAHDTRAVESFEQLEEVDAAARDLARALVSALRG